MSASAAAGSRTEGRGEAQAQGAAAEGIERVYVWDLVVRLSHWIIAFSILGLAVTGIYIGRPFLSPSGPANQQFVMAHMKTVHFYIAIVFTLTVAVRIAWMFVGSYYARWHQFLPVTRQRLRDVAAVFRFYTLIDRNPPLSVGHNPLAGFFYLLVFGLYLVMITTGLALYSVSATGYMEKWDFLLPILGGPQMARWIHHVTMWFIIGFFAHHIWSAILTSRVEGQGILDSMFSGYKFLPRSWRKK